MVYNSRIIVIFDVCVRGLKYRQFKKRNSFYTTYNAINEHEATNFLFLSLRIPSWPSLSLECLARSSLAIVIGNWVEERRYVVESH